MIHLHIISFQYVEYVDESSLSRAIGYIYSTLAGHGHGHGHAHAHDIWPLKHCLISLLAYEHTHRSLNSEDYQWCHEV